MSQSPVLESTLRRMDHFWSACLGVEPEAFALGRIVLVPQFLEDERDTLYLLLRGQTCIASVISPSPPATLNQAEAVIGDSEPADILDPDLWREAFCGRIEHLNGPSWLGCADGGTWDAAGGPGARLAEDPDRGALEAFAAAADLERVRESGVLEPEASVFLAPGAGAIAAAAAIEHWADGLARIGLLTAPDASRDAVGAALRAAGRRALAEGAVLQFRWPEDDGEVIAEAVSAGFRPYARSLSVRLRRPRGC